MPNYPEIPAYIYNPIVFYDAQRGLCLVGLWGDTTSSYWLLVARNGTWISDRQLTDKEIKNLDTLRTKDIRA